MMKFIVRTWKIMENGEKQVFINNWISFKFSSDLAEHLKKQTDLG
jgi:ribosome-associated toxin RatA of RatAB toxin-antitoxin module